MVGGRFFIGQFLAFPFSGAGRSEQNLGGDHENRSRLVGMGALVVSRHPCRRWVSSLFLAQRQGFDANVVGKMIRLLMVAIGMLVQLLLPRATLAEDWQIAAQGSQLRFVARYQGEPVPGEFLSFITKLTLDADDLKNSSLVVVVDIASLSLGSADLEEGAATAEWFDFDRYPTAEFRSNHIRQMGDNAYEAIGELSIKGVARILTVPFVLDKTPSNAVMTGRVDLVRSHFGVGSGEWAEGDLIGLQVTVIFRVRLQPAVGNQNE
jgi:polyisoprenoid-binding protein YceI